ncbi:MAG: nuclear transport factor 2 family protein [Salinivirgaceae bacterium]
MKKIYCISTVFFLVLNSPVFSNTFSGHSPDSTEIQNVQQVVVDSYVNGIFLKGDYKLVKKGWHPDCDIVILENGRLKKLPAQYWVDRLKEHPKPLDSNVTYKFIDVKVTGYAAIAIIEIFSKGKPLYTDYMSLYKFKDGWKIATKIYYSHPVSSNKN